MRSLDRYPVTLLKTLHAAMAMSMQNQQAGQQPMGDFADMAAAMATPQGKKGPAEAGLSPSAKRPLSRTTFIRQTVGVPKPMDINELNAGFHNLMALQARDEGFATSINGCVTFNARLLNDTVDQVLQLIDRMGKVEAGAAKQQVTVNTMKVAVEGAIDLVNRSRH